MVTAFMRRAVRCRRPKSALADSSSNAFQYWVPAACNRDKRVVYLNYEEGTPDNWDEINMSAERDGSSITLTGLCPRCSHSVQRSLRELIGAALSGGQSRYIVRLKCNCAAPHPGGPPG